MKADGKKLLAVLPFVSAVQDSNAEYLSDGIAKSVSNNLSRFSGLFAELGGKIYCRK